MMVAMSVAAVGVAVTVVGATGLEIDPVIVVTPAAAGTTGAPITISPIVVLTDPDSDLGSATVTIEDAAAGDELT